MREASSEHTPRNQSAHSLSFQTDQPEPQKLRHGGAGFPELALES